MKNLLNLIALTTILLLASCSKEALIEPQTDANKDIEIVEVEKTKSPTIAIARANANGIDVTVASSFSTPTELNIDFTSNHDFTGSTLAGIQTIDFVDVRGETVSLSFEVNSYTGGNGTLDISLAIGGNNLTGLGLKTDQIVVDELIIN